jgi:hypothetical protein
MNSLSVFFLMAAAVFAPILKAEDAPRYFDVLTKERYVLVILHESGKAEYLHREMRPDGTLWFFHDPASTWGYFPDLPKNAWPNVWVKTHRFRRDYHLENERLTEFEKTGKGNVLTERKNDVVKDK